MKYLEGNQAYISKDDIKSRDTIVVLGGMLSDKQKPLGIDFE